MSAGFAAVRGQDRAVEILRRALAAGKLPHALVFAGPPGVGKRLTARALALALLCEAHPGDGCGVCGPCRKVLQGIHPDALTLAPEGAGNEILIEKIRDLAGKLAFAPHEGAARVVIVADADRLRLEAANAFLKTLEEPPPRTHFVLCTAAPDRLLQTIRSRCQRIRFTPLPLAAVVELLGEAGVPAARAREAAAMAGGSLARAREIAEEGLGERHERVATILRAAAAPGLEAVIQTAAALAAEKAALPPILELLALTLRDAAALAAGVPAASLSFGAVAGLAELAHGRSAAELARAITSVLDAQAALLGHAQPALVLERMMLALRDGRT